MVLSLSSVAISLRFTLTIVVEPDVEEVTRVTS